MKSFHAFLIILALTAVFGGVLSQKNDKPDVLSEVAEQTSTPIATQTSSPESIATPQSSATPRATMAPTATPQSINQETPMLVFPGAKIISQNNDQTVLEIETNPNEVSKWYQTKLRELGMNALAVSQTNTNNNFSAKISAADAEVKYDIEIKKAASENNVTIILR